MSKKYDHEISLLTECLRVKGLKVVDVWGYVSHEFGDPCFKLTRLLLSDDTTIDVEGEHDHPYLTGTDEQFDFPEEQEDES